jgi:hypothetical protein
MQLMDGRILNYDIALSRRVRWRRRAVSVICVISIVIAMLSWGPPLVRRVRFDYWRHECLTCVMPTGLLLFDTDNPNANPPICAADEGFERVAHVDQYVHTPDMRVIFLHEMRRPDGTPRLVRLRLDPMIRPANWYFFNARVLDISGAADSEVFAGKYWGILASDHLKVFDGQIDPGNPSHFTFDYEFDGVRRTSDVWLTNEDELVFSPWPKYAN